MSGLCARVATRLTVGVLLFSACQVPTAESPFRTYEPPKLPPETAPLPADASPPAVVLTIYGIDDAPVELTSESEPVIRRLSSAKKVTLVAGAHDEDGVAKVAIEGSGALHCSGDSFSQVENLTYLSQAPDQGETESALPTSRLISKELDTSDLACGSGDEISLFKASFAAVGYNRSGATQTTAQFTLVYEPAKGCTIELARDGATHIYSKTLGVGDTADWSSLEDDKADGILATSGPCHFTVFEQKAFGGRRVTLGSNLSVSGMVDGIWAGEDGLMNPPGAETWDIRSVRMERVDTSCTLRAGADYPAYRTRMDYYNGELDRVPGMYAVDWFVGGDCRAMIWDYPDFGSADRHNRFKALQPSGKRPAPYEPGFGLRSLKIWNEGAECVPEASDFGRCLPRTVLTGNLYSVRSNQDDLDLDGLVDALENELADAFRPIYVNHSSENVAPDQIATRTADTYKDPSTGKWVIEPVTLFYVRPEGAGEIYLHYEKLWRKDVWADSSCGDGHEGDAQGTYMYLRTLDDGKEWIVYKTTGAAGQFDWEEGDAQVRGVQFERWPGEANVSGTANHLVVYFSSGKHHEFPDGGYSGQVDPDCGAGGGRAYIDSRGERNDPPLPKRIAVLRSPEGAGDRYGFNNVGCVGHPFFGELGPYGYAGESLWSGTSFYEGRGGYADVNSALSDDPPPWTDVFLCEASSNPAPPCSKTSCEGVPCCSGYVCCGDRSCIPRDPKYKCP